MPQPGDEIVLSEEDKLDEIEQQMQSTFIKEVEENTNESPELKNVSNERLPKLR